ncbi:exported hypothetical protein [Candidatus Desulfarcum epimagneticum]|uniref:RapA2 cadherin-like domain-containing protein n=1 Tax=uncultured Desulfobacteraceae bacterium TaxID=218296 RepID=A0A484HG33_9BACT|nr:exported hypothetical protein [uncultured Desulfobacteraceae bacterium]
MTGKNIVRIRAAALALLTLIFLTSVNALAGTYATSVENAATWLENQQNRDGSWGDDGAIRFVYTSEAVKALRDSVHMNSSYYNGITWLENHNPLNHDSRARRIAALVPHGDDVDEDIAGLVAVQGDDASSDGLGWGTNPGYYSSPMDTAIVMSALADHPAALQKATEYLKSSRLTGSEKGWGMSFASKEDASSDAISTARVIRALIPLRAGDPGLSQIISDATSDLSHDVTDASPAMIKARAALAFLESDPACPRGLELLGQIHSTREADGEWGNVYLTSLALQAMSIVESGGSPSPGSRVVLNDQNLRSLINGRLGKRGMDALTRRELEKITDLDLSGSGITDFTGLEHAVNLQSLTINLSQTSEVWKLAGLSSLTDVTLNIIAETDVRVEIAVHDRASVDIKTKPSHGEAEIDDGKNSLGYTTFDGYTGTDSFSYTEGSITVSVNVEARQRPTAANDYYCSDAAAGALSITALDGVLANDSRMNSDDPFTAVEPSAAQNGRVTLNADGSFDYTPGDGFTGTDSFEYTAYDGTMYSDEATVSISPRVVFADPDLLEAINGELNRTGPISRTELESRLTTLDVRSFQIEDFTGLEHASHLTSLTVTPPQNSILDGWGSQRTPFTFTVAMINRAPVLNTAQSHALSSISEDPGSSNSGNLVSEIVANGSITDPDGDAREAIAVTEVDNAHGDWQYSTDSGATWINFGAATADADAALLDQNDHIRFVPDANWNGRAAFSFRAWDKSDGASSGSRAAASTNGGGAAFSSHTASASIQVTAVNDPPAGQNDSYSFGQGISAPYRVDLSVAAPGVLINDTDPDRDTLEAVLIESPSHGTLQLENDGSFSYTTSNGYIGSDTFTYQAKDTNGSHSDNTTVSISVTVGYGLMIQGVSQTMSKDGNAAYSGAAVADTILSHLLSGYLAQNDDADRQEQLMSDRDATDDGVLSLSEMKAALNHYLHPSTRYNYKNTADRLHYAMNQDFANFQIAWWLEGDPSDIAPAPVAVTISSNPHRAGGGGADSDYRHWMTIVGHSTRFMFDRPSVYRELNGFVVSDPAAGGMGSEKYIQASEWNSKYFRPIALGLEGERMYGYVMNGFPTTEQKRVHMSAKTPERTIAQGLEGAGMYGAAVEPPETEGEVHAAAKTPEPNPDLTRGLERSGTDFQYKDFWADESSSSESADDEIKEALMKNRDFMSALELEPYKSAFMPENVGRVIKVESRSGDYALVLFEKNDNGRLITTGAAIVCLSHGIFKEAFSNPDPDFFDEAERWKAICHVFSWAGARPVNAWAHLEKDSPLDYGHKVVAPSESGYLTRFHVYQAEKDGAVFLLDASPSIELISSKKAFAHDNWVYEDGRWSDSGTERGRGWQRRVAFRITDDVDVTDVKWSDSLRLIRKEKTKDGYVYEFMCDPDESEKVVTAMDQNYKGNDKTGGISYFRVK